MKKVNPKVEAYIEKSADFAKPILKHLRQLIHTTCPEVDEEIKWGIPHFDYKGEMMCIAAAFKNHCSFTFWKAELMSDTKLKGQTKLKATERYMGKITSLSDLPAKAVLMAYIKEAMMLNEKGVKIVKPKPGKPKEIATPDYFIKVLAKNPAVRKIFEAKSDSFRKEYLVWITDAKTDATREKRIEQALEWIAEGKGRFWQYAKK